MIVTLTEVKLAADSSLTLSADVVGDGAYATLHDALQPTGDPQLTACNLVHQDAHVVIVTGTLASLLGAGAASVRLYIFDVPTVFDNVERHAILLLSVPTGYTPDKFLAHYSHNKAVDKFLSASSFLTQLTFAEQILMLSTLDYDSPIYDKPPFPPDGDPDAPKSFLKSVKGDATLGYTCRMTATWNSTINIPTGDGTSEPLSIQPILKTLHLDSLATFSGTLTSQIQLDSPGGAKLVLLYDVPNASISLGSVPFGIRFESLGLEFLLGSEGTIVPTLDLAGALEIGTWIEARASFDLPSRSLSLDLFHFPTFDQLVENFSGFDLHQALLGRLPVSGLAELGEISLVELAVEMDLESPKVTNLRFSITTEHGFSLLDVVTVYPGVMVKVAYPFDSFRSFEVDVFGKWFLGKSEFDTSLVVTNDGYQIQAALALGSTLSISDVASELFGGQVTALPTLNLTGLEFYGSKQDSTTSYELDIDIESGWHLDGIPLELDNASLHVAFADGKLEEATLQATLDVAGAFFNLNAEYDGTKKGWFFSGGTAPGTTINVGTFLEQLASHLGVGGHGDLLSSFEKVSITGFYLEYSHYQDTSSIFDLHLSLDTGVHFEFLPLTEIIIRFRSEGEGMAWHFDALADTSQGKSGVDQLKGYINSKHSVNVSLPSSLDVLQLEGLSAHYNSSTKDYGFTAYAVFEASAYVHLQFDVLHQADGSKETDVSGTVIFHPGEDDELRLELELTSEAGVSDLVASLHADSPKTLSLGRLASAILNPPPGDVADLDIDIQDALFVHNGQNGGRSLFAVDMGAGINLSGLGDLPLIGSELAAGKTLKLDFHIVYATGDFSADELSQVNESLGKAAFKFPAASLKGGELSLATALRLGNEPPIDVTFQVQLKKDGTLQKKTEETKTEETKTTETKTEETKPDETQSGSQEITTSAPGTPATGNIRWFPIKKSFGPLHLERVGLAFDSKAMSLEGDLDGSISLFGLSVSVMGLHAKAALTGADRFVPHFGIDGLGLDFKKGPVEIGGALVKIVTPQAVEFDGFVTLKAEELEIGAIGSFAEMNDGAKSLFIYAVLDMPLGGPPFFFVTGLAAGFGYNRRLLMPPMDQVAQYPLVAEAITSSPAPSPTDVGKVRSYISTKMAMMERYIPPATGEYFLTAGDHFTSFELFDSFLLVAVQFGEHFEIDALGLTTVLIPPDDSASPLAEAQLALKLVFIPDEGVVLIQGQLTPASFILSHDCQLTGGFAFGLWAGGPHAGNFVITLGGYHPDYKVPAFYPKVPRVGFNWAVSSELHVKGGGYFALVTHALMAGGSLNAVFQSGSLKAWFLLGADFLISWKPFHYDAHIYVDLGAEVTIHFFGTHHICIDASADLHVWGPEFGGHARITVNIIGIHIHFSVSFGASVAPPPPIPWSEFRDSFLPAADKRLSATATGGLIRTVKDPKYGEIWVVKRDQLRFETHSCLPVASVHFELDGTKVDYDPGSFTVAGISPMDLETIEQSAHTISISRLTAGRHEKETAPAENLTLVNVMKKYPEALWGHAMERELNPPEDKKLISALSGFQIVPETTSHEDPHPIVASREALAYEITTQVGYNWKRTGTFQPASGQPSWQDINAQVSNTRSERETLLQSMGFDPAELSGNQPLERDTFFVPQYGTLED